MDFYIHFHVQLLEKIFVFSWKYQNKNLWQKKKCISHVFHKILLELWKSLFDHFINKGPAHAGASQAEALDLTMDCELQCPWQL